MSYNVSPGLGHQLAIAQRTIITPRLRKARGPAAEGAPARPWRERRKPGPAEGPEPPPEGAASR